MLIKLAFKPSTNKASDKEGNPGTEMVPFPTHALPICYCLNASIVSNHVSMDEQIELWHERLGHMNFRDLRGWGCIKKGKGDLIGDTYPKAKPAPKERKEELLM